MQNAMATAAGVHALQDEFLNTTLIVPKYSPYPNLGKTGAIELRLQLVRAAISA
jgi:hypothetical protein